MPNDLAHLPAQHPHRPPRSCRALSPRPPVHSITHSRRSGGCPSSSTPTASRDFNNMYEVQQREPSTRGVLWAKAAILNSMPQKVALVGNRCRVAPLFACSLCDAACSAYKLVGRSELLLLLHDLLIPIAEHTSLGQLHETLLRWIWLLFGSCHKEQRSPHPGSMYCGTILLCHRPQKPDATVQCCKTGGRCDSECCCKAPSQTKEWLPRPLDTHQPRAKQRPSNPRSGHPDT